MTRRQVEVWLGWRERVGLPPLPRERIDELLGDDESFVIDYPRKVQAYRKVRLLFGLITYHKVIEQ